MADQPNDAGAGGAPDLSGVSDDDLLAMIGKGQVDLSNIVPSMGAAGGGARAGRGPIDYAPAPETLDALGMSADQYQTYRGYLLRRESSGNYGDLSNPSGHIGGYQMGPSEIRGAANRLGLAVPSAQQFVSNPELQEQLFENYTVDHARQLTSNPAFANGDGATRAGILAGAHLGGIGGVSRYLASGGQDNAADSYGTSIGNYVHGMMTAESGSGGGGLGPSPGSGPVMLGAMTFSPEQMSMVNNMYDQLSGSPGAGPGGPGSTAPGPGAGPAAPGPGAGPRPGSNQPGGMVTAGEQYTGSTQAALGAKPDWQLLDADAADAQVQRSKGIAGELMPASPLAIQVSGNRAEGYNTYRTPDGQIVKIPISGDPRTDPAIVNQQRATAAEAAAAAEPRDITIHAPDGRSFTITTTQSVAIPYQRGQGLPQALADRIKTQFGFDPNLPTGATTGAPGATPGAPGATPGATPRAPGATSGAPGATPGATPGAPGGTAPGVPGAAGGPLPQTLPNGMTITTPEHGPTLIDPPAAAALPPGLMVRPTFGPGGEEAATNVVRGDFGVGGTLDHLKADSDNATQLLARVNSIQAALPSVYTGTSGPTRQRAAELLQAAGFSPEAIEKVTRTNPDKAFFLEKALMQLVTDQMAQVPGQGGFGVMQKVQDALPSIEKSPNSINMLLNGIKMAAQRSIDMYSGALDFSHKSLNASNQTVGMTPYTPLRDWVAQFNTRNSADEYYKTAQAMTRGFSNEIWKQPGMFDAQGNFSGAHTILRHLREGDYVYHPNGARLLFSGGKFIPVGQEPNPGGG